MSGDTNLTKVAHRVDTTGRANFYGHPGAVVWLTGLSAAGKSTLAMGTEARLMELGYSVYVLDGDNVRHGLNSDLGFTPNDRKENIRRVGHMAALFADAGLICVTAFISPYREDRRAAREAASQFRFTEVYVAASVEACEARDPKGLYAKARAGKLSCFTGIDAPYEIPECPELTIETTLGNEPDCVEILVNFIVKRFPKLHVASEPIRLAALIPKQK